MPEHPDVATAGPDDDPAALTHDDVVALLTHGDLELEGRLVTASNATFYGRSTLDGVSTACVYKPVQGERPLWDFPDGTLAGREVAAYAVSQLAGWGVVPPTVLTAGPFGDGMRQQWVDGPDDPDLVDLVGADAVPEGWLHVLDAVDQHDQEVSLVHRDDPALRSMAVFDAVVNNADRKGGHVLRAYDGTVLGCDHGVSLHVEPKLRTVLWGWAGDELAEPDRAALERLDAALGDDDRAGDVARHLTGEEVAALHARCRLLLGAGRHPRPRAGGPVIPWPAF